MAFHPPGFFLLEDSDEQFLVRFSLFGKSFCGAELEELKPLLQHTRDQEEKGKPERFVLLSLAPNIFSLSL